MKYTSNYKLQLSATMLLLYFDFLIHKYQDAAPVSVGFSVSMVSQNIQHMDKCH